MNKPYSLVIGFLALASMAGAEERAPLMGWSSWNTYGLGISADLIKEQADAMVSSGLKDAGYKFINIDDGFWNGRASDGTLIIDESKFPNGMRVVADYIHSLGLKAGIYSDAGDNTCGSQNSNPYGLGVGLFRHEVDDIMTYFIDWDYDFIKVDYCGGIHLNLDERLQYTKISEAIKNCGKEDLHFNICRWAYPGTWVEDIADSWRTTEDIWDSWESVKNILSQNLYMSAYCCNGHYNDMDMLEVGRSLSSDEDLTHFAMWCILDSPLLVGCDMRNMKPETIALLTNEELIALNQDPLHLQAYIAYKSGDVFVLVKDVEEKYGTKRAVALYNPSDRTAQVTLDFEKIDLGGNVRLRDLAQREDIGILTDGYRVTVPAHGVRVFSADAGERLERTRYEAESGYISDYQELINNEVMRTGVYTYDNSCSGGMKVNWLGYKPENDLCFQNVYSRNGGEYEIAIACLTADDRDICIEVNGEAVASLTANTGGYDKIGMVTEKITLQPGENSIRLYNTDYFMPDIDYFDLRLLNTEAVIDSIEKVEDDSFYYSLTGLKVTQPNLGEIYVKKKGNQSSKIIFKKDITL